MKRYNLTMEHHLKIIEALTRALDREFKIFNIRFGLDPIIGLVPGIGDLISFVLSLYIVWVAMKFKLPTDKFVQMIANIVFDFLLGLFPVIGDAADFLFQANYRNIQILKAHLKENRIIDGEIILDR